MASANKVSIEWPKAKIAKAAIRIPLTRTTHQVLCTVTVFMPYSLKLVKRYKTTITLLYEYSNNQ